jgi:DNA polymerase V
VLSSFFGVEVASRTARRAQAVPASANLTVFIETNPFRKQDSQYHASRSVRLPVATANRAKLIAASLRALDALLRPGYR